MAGWLCRRSQPAVETARSADLGSQPQERRAGTKRDRGMAARRGKIRGEGEGGTRGPRRGTRRERDRVEGSSGKGGRDKERPGVLRVTQLGMSE